MTRKHDALMDDVLSDLDADPAATAAKDSMVLRSFIMFLPEDFNVLTYGKISQTRRSILIKRLSQIANLPSKPNKNAPDQGSKAF